MAHDESPIGSRTSYITCPLCEATCGLEVVASGPEVVSIRGNKNDVFSRGYICPKAYALKELHSDPDRIRAPMIRTGETWREVTWDEAFAEIDRRLVRPSWPNMDATASPHTLATPPFITSPATLQRRPAARARLGQHLHRQHRGPDAQAGLLRPDVRPLPRHPHPQCG